MVVTERLSSLTGSSLVTWTADKYGPPVSYSHALTPANYFEIVVDAATSGRENDGDDDDLGGASSSGMSNLTIVNNANNP